MTVSASSSMEQTQMRKMDGSGGGQGKGGGMKEMMQSLSSEDQAAMKTEMSSLSMEDRMEKISQMKEVDKTKMTDEEYTQTLFDILDTSNTNKAETEGFSVYA